MTVQKDAPQDDYYAQVSTSQKSGSDDKKPTKLKLKAVVKKPSDGETQEVPSAPVLKIVKKLPKISEDSSSLESK